MKLSDILIQQSKDRMKAKAEKGESVNAMGAFIDCLADFLDEHFGQCRCMYCEALYEEYTRRHGKKDE